MLSIRQAKPEDASVLAAAERVISQLPGFLVSKPHELTDERFRQTIIELSESKSGRYLVAEMGNEVAGHAFLEAMSLEAISHVVRLTIAIHPGSQGKGIGQALLQTLIAWAKEEKTIEKIELNVRATNLAAQKLYLKLGFIEEGRLSRRIKISEDQYLDDVLMGLWVK